MMGTRNLNAHKHILWTSTVALSRTTFIVDLLDFRQVLKQSACKRLHMYESHYYTLKSNTIWNFEISVSNIYPVLLRITPQLVEKSALENRMQNYNIFFKNNSFS